MTLFVSMCSKMFGQLVRLAKRYGDKLYKISRFYHNATANSVPFWHMEHTYGFSDVWIRSCEIKLLEVENPLPTVRKKIIYIA